MVAVSCLANHPYGIMGWAALMLRFVTEIKYGTVQRAREEALAVL